MKPSKTLFLALASLALALSSCGENPVTSSSISSSEEESSSEISSEISSSEEESSSSSDSSSALPEWHDYAYDGSVKLALDYKGHTFANDGIEQVTVRKSGSSYIGFIDGDTTHFTTSTGVLKSRYYGIDTPESTGKVQPWGKEASDYTKSVLKEADQNGTIVVSSPQDDYGSPEPDSTGERYVSLIWVNTSVKNAPFDQLVLLNLLIVQNGYSWVKNVGDMPAYSPTFYAAQDQAKAYKLNLFSGTIPDSYPSDEIEVVSLLELKKEVVACIEDSTHVNAYHNKRVLVAGTVAGFSNNILYIQDYFEEYDEDGNPTGKGEYAGINIFVGMSAIPSKFTTLNAYISVPGLAQDSENFGFQITDTNFPRVSYDADKDAKVILTPEQNEQTEHALHTFSYTPSSLQEAITSNSYESLYCNVKITEPMTVTGGYDSDDGAAFTLQFGYSYSFSVYVTFYIIPDPEDPATTWKSYTNFVGKQINISGVFMARKTTSGKWVFQINPSSNSDIEVIL